MPAKHDGDLSTSILYVPPGTKPYQDLLMYLVAIGWLYVALMMSIAEATNTNGSVLGAIFTFILYGLLPTGLVMYLLGTPARKQRIREREAAELEAWKAAQAASVQPDAGGEAPAGAVPPVGKEP